MIFKTKLETHKSMTKHRLVLGGSLLCVAIGVALMFGRSAPPPALDRDAPAEEESAAADRVTNPSLYRWGAGEQRVYAIDVTSRSTAENASESESEITLEATLFVEVIGPAEDEGTVVRYRFGASSGGLSGVEEGEPYEMPMPALDGQRTHAVVGDDGAVLEWWVSADTDLAAQQLFEQLVVELQPQLELAATWSREERTSLGEAETAYEVTAADAMSATIARRRVHTARCTCRQLGTSRRSAHTPARRSTAASCGRSTLTRRCRPRWRTSACSSSRLPSTRPSCASVASQSLRRSRRLKRRVAQASADLPLAQRASLLARLRGMTAGVDAGGPFRVRADRRATQHPRVALERDGLLRLDPTLATDVVSFASDPSVEGQGHAFALQLLGGAGHAEAQTAMRDILSLPNVQADSGYDQLVQRGVLVSELTEDSVAFYAELAADEDPSVSLSASNVMASAANQALERGDTARSAELARRFVEDFEEASSAEERRERMRVMGNTEDPSMADPILEASYDDDPNIRGAATRGLRNQTGPEVDDRLFELALDGDVHVRRHALESMTEHGMGGPRPGTRSRLRSLPASLRARRAPPLARARVHRGRQPGARRRALDALSGMPGISGRTAQALMQLRMMHELALAE